MTQYDGPKEGNVCEEFIEDGCCNHFQMAALSFNFLLLDSAFGNLEAGGCPACTANIKKLYCAFTCSPNQADWVTPIGVFENVVRTAAGTVCIVSLICHHSSQIQLIQRQPTQYSK